jgi:hypothetical protein
MALEQMVAHHQLPDLEQRYYQLPLVVHTIIYLMEEMVIPVVVEVALVVIPVRGKSLLEATLEDKKLKDQTEHTAHLEAVAAAMTMDVGIVINLVMAATLIFMEEEIMV